MRYASLTIASGLALGALACGLAIPAASGAHVPAFGLLVLAMLCTLGLGLASVFAVHGVATIRKDRARIRARLASINEER